MTPPPDPVREHERACPACKHREWCETAMDLIAQKRGHLSFDLLLAATEKERRP